MVDAFTWDYVCGYRMLFAAEAMLKLVIRSREEMKERRPAKDRRELKCCRVDTQNTKGTHAKI